MTEDHDEVEALLREAGPLPQPSDDLVQAVKTASREAWQTTVVRHRAQRRRWVGMSAAAGLVLAIALGFYTADDVQFNVNIVQATGIRVDDEPREPGQAILTSGSKMLTTASARLVARNDVDLRLKATTTINWLAPNHVYLESGALYVDTHGNAAFHVDTREGTIRDIGTRYLVSVGANSVGLAVREGEAEVIAELQTLVVRGDGVNAQVATLSRGDVIVTNEAASDDRWNWIFEVPANYPDKTIRELLEYVSADLGKQLIFESRGVEAATVNLRMTTGSLQGVGPSEALRAIVESSGLRLVETDNEVRIGF